MNRESFNTIIIIVSIAIITMAMVTEVNNDYCCQKMKILV